MSEVSWKIKLVPPKHPKSLKRCIEILKRCNDVVTEAPTWSPRTWTITWPSFRRLWTKSRSRCLDGSDITGPRGAPSLLCFQLVQRWTSSDWGPAPLFP